MKINNGIKISTALAALLATIQADASCPFALQGDLQNLRALTSLASKFEPTYLPESDSFEFILSSDAVRTVNVDGFVVPQVEESRDGKVTLVVGKDGKVLFSEPFLKLIEKYRGAAEVDVFHKNYTVRNNLIDDSWTFKKGNFNISQLEVNRTSDAYVSVSREFLELAMGASAHCAHI